MPEYGMMLVNASTTVTSYNIVVSSSNLVQMQYTTAYGAGVVQHAWYNDVVQPVTAEQVRTQALAAEATRQEKIAATRKAEDMLKSMLDDRQRSSYSETASFEVLVTRTGEIRRYLVERDWAGNVFRVDQHGRKIERFCIHPEKQIPLPDNMLAQKLLLEADEQTFLRTANRSIPGKVPGTWVPAERAA